jgi:FixJ family two-component response regulator
VTVPLSPRQREVALRVVRGEPSKRIARDLKISRASVNQYVMRISARIPEHYAPLDAPARNRIIIWHLSTLLKAA